MSLVKLDNDLGLDNYLKVSTCIDYFEIVFIGQEFDQDDILWRKLAVLLYINPVERDDKVKSNELFANVYIYDANIYVHSNFRKKSEDDEPRFKIQMAGQACREFEQRGGDWLKLFEFCKTQRHNVTRIDLACDDFYYLDLEELKEYIHRHWYTSNFRKTCKEVYIPGASIEFIKDTVDLDSPLYPKIIAEEQREGLSYSATWGTPQTCQLQIYDKMQERRHAGYEVIGDHWIRFEMKLRKEVAEIAFNYVIEAMKNNTFSLLCARLLYGYMDFKHEAWSSDDRNHYYRLSTFPKYLSFLGDLTAADKLKIKKPLQQVDIERVMAKKRRWIKNSVSKSALMLFAEDPDTFLSELQDFMAEKVKDGKFTSRDAAIVNYGRMYKGKGVLTFADYKEFFESNLGVRPDDEDKSQDDYFFEEDLPF